ncbi:MAG: C40 family peptidase [Hydrogenophaga sp.]|nr:C40 family peptidase [Hydrogenophaga sp.]
MIADYLIDEIKAFVNASPAREVCGLIVSYRRKHIFMPCANVASQDNEFVIDPAEFAELSDQYKIICVVHSHININPAPSQADLIEIERHQLPYFIMNYPLNTHTYTEPSGYQAPYVGRHFAHGITDCYAIWRDYYQRELGIEMIDYARGVEWWLKGDNLYLQNYKDAGFVPVDNLQPHDIILMQVASPVPNHCAVYLGDNVILHHVMGKASSRDVYGGYWRKITNLVLRHYSLC